MNELERMYTSTTAAPAKAPEPELKPRRSSGATSEATGPGPASTPPTPPPCSATPTSTFEPAPEPTYDWVSDVQSLSSNSSVSLVDFQLAMAEDFSEGRLETFVSTPQKELPGTKDAYVSYLVTTKVGILP